MFDFSFFFVLSNIENTKNTKLEEEKEQFLENIKIVFYVFLKLLSRNHTCPIFLLIKRSFFTQTPFFVRVCLKIFRLCH